MAEMCFAPNGLMRDHSIIILLSCLVIKEFMEITVNSIYLNRTDQRRGVYEAWGKEIGLCKAVLNYTCSWKLRIYSWLLQIYVSWKSSIGYSRASKPPCHHLLSASSTYPITHSENPALSGFGFGHISQSFEGVMSLMGLSRFSSGSLSGKLDWGLWERSWLSRTGQKVWIDLRLSFVLVSSCLI